MAKSTAKTVISRIIGFLIFLVLLGIANILIPLVHNSMYASIIDFLNINISFILIIAVMGLVNEIFWSFYFPFNILAPITGAILGFYVITFIYQILLFLQINLENIPINQINILVFWLILILGYIIILARNGKPSEAWHETKRERAEQHRLEIEKNIADARGKMKHEHIEWSEVGEEFKLALYNLGRTINDLFNNNHNKNKSKARKKK